MRLFETNNYKIKERYSFPVWFLDPGSIILFETFACDYGKTYFLKEHLIRTYKAQKILNIQSKIDIEKLYPLLINFFKRFNKGYYRCRLLYNTAKDIIYVILIKEKRVIIPHDGVNCIISKFISPYSLGISCDIKSINHYLSFALAQKEARENNCFEAILVDRAGALLEGSHTNIFFIKNNTIFYPDKNILAGVTRSIIIDIAISEGIHLKGGVIYKDSISNFDSMFLTGSLTGIAEVKEIRDIRKFDVHNEIIKKIRKIYERKIKD
ncbi:MAG: aminotransferase class IV [Candidatus Hydrogenedentota bacterium]